MKSDPTDIWNNWLAHREGLAAGHTDKQAASFAFNRNPLAATKRGWLPQGKLCQWAFVLCLCIAGWLIWVQHTANKKTAND